jgi:23S rRNA (cytidine1920-2'-O)/16S rRNA (cytidine1409-2'-O)-methyltransferase
MSDDRTYVTRGGLKLEAGLAAFDVDVADAVTCDLGSHQGGFVDCLLAHGARKVYSVDTSYGTLAWTLRQDDRVVVMERTSAMHVELPEPVSVVTADLGWTRQEKFVPHAMELLAPGGVLISLLKPQYEARDDERARGVVLAESIESVRHRVCGRLAEIAFPVERFIESPIKGGKGNVEYLLLLRRPGT